MNSENKVVSGQPTKRAVNFAHGKAVVHIAPWGDIERAHGRPRAALDDAVVEVHSIWSECDLVALCGAPVAVGGVFCASAASDRAVRAEPSRFELMPLCGDCVRAFALGPEL